MAEKQVEVKLFPNGNMSVETHNIKGKACVKYMELFANLLNARITDSEYTPEYYETETNETVEEQEVEMA